MKTTLKLITWLVCFILAVNFSFECLTASSAMANIIGAFAFGLSLAISYETKCFTQFKKQKGNESNQED